MFEYWFERIERIKAARALRSDPTKSVSQIPASQLRVGDLFVFGNLTFTIMEVNNHGATVEIIGEYGCSYVVTEYLSFEMVPVQLPRPRLDAPRSLR